MSVGSSRVGEGGVRVYDESFYGGGAEMSCFGRRIAPLRRGCGVATMTIAAVSAANCRLCGV
jgi:hypothetical protein